MECGIVTDLEYTLKELNFCGNHSEAKKREKKYMN